MRVGSRKESDAPDDLTTFLRLIMVRGSRYGVLFGACGQSTPCFHGGQEETSVRGVEGLFAVAEECGNLLHSWYVRSFAFWRLRSPNFCVFMPVSRF